MAEADTTTINLLHDVTVNGVTYKKGSGVTVPKNKADDIMRIAHEHQAYLNNLHVRNTYEQNAGSIQIGSGAA